MKKIFVTLVISLIGILPIVAQTVEHVVERGETISSIASKYKISESQLLEANPAAKDLFYAGMVLAIPNVKENTIVSNTNQVLNNNKKDSDNSNNTGYNSQNNSQSKSENSSQTISFESDKRYPNLKIDKGDKSVFMKLRYNIDLTLTQRNFISDKFPEIFKTKSKADIFEILNALFFLIKTGCQWRLLPNGFPRWRTVYEFYRKWLSTGFFDRLT